MGMNKIIFAGDCETDPFKKGRVEIIPFIWGLYTEENGKEIYKQFDTSKELIEYLRDIRSICYFHNGGKFDYYLGEFFNYFEEWDTIKIIAGRISSFKIGECEYRDSMNIIPLGLKAAHDKQEFDYSKLEKDVRHLYKAEIEEYLYLDCKYLHQLVSAFISNYGASLTVASAALKQWKELGNDIPETDANYYELFAPYYYGGRVEVFKGGHFKGNFKVVDINSAYPTAMKYAKHPYHLPTSFYDSGELPKDREVLAASFIILTARSTGAFPYRTEDKKLSFPFDTLTRTFCITGHEFLAAKETGTLKDYEIKRCIYYDKDQLIDFAEYVDKFYKLKQESEKGSLDYTFAKLMLNSLYGKWASNPSKYGKHFFIHPAFIEAAEMEGAIYTDNIGGLALMKADLEDGEMKYLNLATAASITGYVRAYMWRSICDIGINNVYYCDTDSIVCSNTGSLKIGDGLGEWDIEANNCPNIYICGKKLYAIETDRIDEKTGAPLYKMASKGARLSPLDIIEISEGKTIEYVSLAPTYSLKAKPALLERSIKLTY